MDRDTVPPKLVTTWNASILLVDDNPTNLSILSEYLKDYGFQILAARNGESAVQKALYARPDIILLDVLMPGIDGFEACKRLKNNPTTRDIPVIFMTALADAEYKVKGFEVGAGRLCDKTSPTRGGFSPRDDSPAAAGPDP